MGLDAEPMFTRVFRFERASAQMRVGPRGRCCATCASRLAARAPGLRVAGGGYDGIGSPTASGRAGPRREYGQRRVVDAPSATREPRVTRRAGLAARP